MTPPSAPKRPGGRPRNTVPVDTSTDDPADRLRVVIDIGIGAIEADMAKSVENGDADRVLALTAKSSEIRGQIVRADANVSRRKLTLPQIEKAVSELTEDEREHLLDKFAERGSGRSVLG